jgi:hypothetical protein
MSCQVASDPNTHGVYLLSLPEYRTTDLLCQAAMCMSQFVTLPPCGLLLAEPLTRESSMHRSTSLQRCLVQHELGAVQPMNRP